jgi:hypothetical protein
MIPMFRVLARVASAVATAISLRVVVSSRAVFGASHYQR